MKKSMLAEGFLTLWFLFGAFGISTAQEKTDPLEMETLDEVVVTTSKMPRTPGNVTQDVSIIGEDQIQNIVTGNGNLSELLTHEPGEFIRVLSRNDANWGSSGGLSQKYNTYMLNGLPVDFFMEPQSLSALAVERIEIQRGPAAVLYPNYLSMDFAGNQSPLTGTTNIILKERVKKQLTALDAHYGSYNTFGGSFYHQQAVDTFHVLFGGDYESSDYTNYGTKDSWLNMIDDPEYEKIRFFARSTCFFNEDTGHKLSLFLNRASHEGDTGRPNRDFDHTYWTVNADYTLPIRDDLTGTLKIGMRDYDRSWEEDQFPESLALASENGMKQRIFPVDLSFSFEHLNGALLTAGADYQNVSYQTFSETDSRKIGNDADADQAGIYVQEEFPIGDFLLRAGARYSHTAQDIHLLSGAPPGNDSASWDKFLWSAGVRYNLNPSVSFFSNAGSSFVVPSLKSIGGTIRNEDRDVPGKNGQLPNPDLDPESGMGYDIGADIKPVDHMKIGVRGFLNRVEDQIVTVVVSENPSQSRDINAGDTQSYGVEFSFEHQFMDEISLFANYTYTHSEIENDHDPDQDGVEVPFVPEHMGNIGAAFHLPMDMQISVWLNMAGDIYDSTSRSGRKKFDAYEILNASLKKGFVVRPDYRVEAYLDLYNITNNRFEMPWQFQDAGFSATGGVKVAF